MKYNIITNLSVFDSNRDPEDESYAERLVKEQDEILKELGFKLDNTCYLIKRGGKHYGICTIEDAIQSLALKDGADLVAYEDTTIGFIGYYNGFSVEENHFKIICKGDNKSLLDMFGNEFDYQDSKELFDDRHYSFEWSKDLYADDLINYLNEKGE